MGRIITLSIAVLVTIGGTGIGLTQTAKQSGDDAVRRNMQHSRQVYDASMAQARTALNGTKDKAADLDAALAAANKAYVYMPGDFNTQFRISDNGADRAHAGVTVTVSKLGSNSGSQFYDLTLQQFNRLLDTGADGHFDVVYEHGGVPPAITGSPSSQGRRAATGPTQPQTSYQQQRTPGQEDVTRETRKYQPPLTPRQIAHPSNIYEQFFAALSAYDDDLVRVAMVRFPYDRQRLAWLEKAQQQRDANNINKTKPLIYPVR